MGEKCVTDTELAALVRDLHGCDTSVAEGYTFHRIQEGYPDGIPRAVFVHPHDEPIGAPLGKYPGAILSLLGRLAADLQDARRARGGQDTYAQQSNCSVCRGQITPYGGAGPVMMSARTENGEYRDGALCERCDQEDMSAGRPERAWVAGALVQSSA